jgi:hypothetical protein
MGTKFQGDMDQFVDELRNALSTAFESDEYRTRRRMVESEIEDRQAAAFEELQGKAQQFNFALMRTPAGLVLAPVKDGEDLQKELQTLLQQIPLWQRELRGNIRDLNHEITKVAVSSILRDLKSDYESYPQVHDFLEAVQKDMVDNASRLLETDEDSEKPAGGPPLPASISKGRADTSLMRRYKVNLFVYNKDSQGSPVIFEDNPTYQNLIGRVEQRARLGALSTDFTLIKPGSLHLANGGYLVLDARKILLQPYAWEAFASAICLGGIKTRLNVPAGTH